MLGSNTTMTVEICQKAKIFVQTTMYNGKLKQKLRICLNESLKTKS